MVLIDSNISHDEFVLTNNVLKEFYTMKQEIKNPITNRNLNYIQNNVILFFKV